jgi:hypothetical protein
MTCVWYRVRFWSLFVLRALEGVELHARVRVLRHCGASLQKVQGGDGAGAAHAVEGHAHPVVHRQDLKRGVAGLRAGQARAQKGWQNVYVAWSTGRLIKPVWM